MEVIGLSTTAMSEFAGVEALPDWAVLKSSVEQVGQPPTPGQLPHLGLQPILHEQHAANAGKTGRLIKPNSMKKGKSLDMRIVASLLKHQSLSITLFQ
jgi:hypothetical protein